MHILVNEWHHEILDMLKARDIPHRLIEIPAFLPLYAISVAAAPAPPSTKPG
jgi:hypothetical protein